MLRSDFIEPDDLTEVSGAVQVTNMLYSAFVSWNKNKHFMNLNCGPIQPIRVSGHKKLQCSTKNPELIMITIIATKMKTPVRIEPNNSFNNTTTSNITNDDNNNKTVPLATEPITTTTIIVTTTTTALLKHDQ